MNFLAHLLLSGDDELLMVGNFIGDWVSNKQLISLPERVQTGVRFHRKIDSYTDTHPVVRECVRKIIPMHGKYAPVVLDVYFDFFLAKNWKDIHQASLQEFAQFAYGILARHLDLIPTEYRQRTSSMIAGDFLRSYTSPAGLTFTFRKMSQRASQPEKFLAAVETMQVLHDFLQERFTQFFPALQRFAHTERQAISTRD
jgi:acyl carrier protein phosphodiesterase